MTKDALTKMTKSQYIKQLGKWFTLAYKNGKKPLNGRFVYCDRISQNEYDKWFDFSLTKRVNYSHYSMEACIHNLNQHTYFELPKIHFIHFCIENNLCNKSLEEAMTLYRLVNSE